MSSLTPSQLARKRANDREAQRAIRQRTKEHIDRLEFELEELKRHQNRDDTVKDLMRRNKHLEDELERLKDELRRINICNPTTYPHAAHPSVYKDSLPGGSELSSQAPGFRRHSPDHHSVQMSDYRGSYIPTPEPSIDSWPSVVQCSVSSTVSSPTSTANDEFGSYLPPNVSPPFHGNGLPPTSAPMIKADVEYEDMEAGHEAYCRPPHPHPHLQQSYLPAGSPWIYPMYTTPSQ